MTAPPQIPRVVAKGDPRVCKTCRQLVRVLVRAHRGKNGIRFAGYCPLCSHHVGAVARSKVADVDQVRLELVADEFDPEQGDLFAGREGGPTELNRRGDGA